MPTEAIRVHCRRWFSCKFVALSSNEIDKKNEGILVENLVLASRVIQNGRQMDCLGVLFIRRVCG